ncbi:zf-C3HC-domain-containing protein [Pluteus cervinus]|uniref:Zf-C3HC-domain-containing protein n=1 Tax=Pluteus cervinus TaxID=181527 RepID=A0ACD3BB64_9AGAR|nr:zf-C3HC-domain-containing protein [Pluteus cervinus]
MASAAQTNTLSAQESTVSSVRATKRKLDDAFQTLDDAVAGSERVDRPEPPKRTQISRSFYSTLAKYGVKTKAAKETPPNESLMKNAPHLSAILSRAATRTRKAFKFSTPAKAATSVSPYTEYRPSSIPSFLSRLSTFKLATYANKPAAIDAVAASKCGWTNDGKDRLICGLCSASWVLAGREGMTRDAANALVEKQKAGLVDMHRDGCPWKTRQCDPSIYRIPLHSPSVMVKEIKSNAIALEQILENVEIRHPLSTTQLSGLRSTINNCELPEEEAPEEGADEHATPPPERKSVSDTAILVCLFGWGPPPPSTQSRRTSGSQTPSSSSRAGTPGPSESISQPFTFRVPSALNLKQDTSLLHCSLCQRRVGLWAFTIQKPPPAPRSEDQEPSTFGEAGSADTPPEPIPTPTSPSIFSPRRSSLSQRHFDLLKEHRSYCPYVVKSTPLPTLPVQPTRSGSISSITTTHTTPSSGHVRSSSSLSQISINNGNGLYEGWRAVLTVILRYGLGQRRRSMAYAGQQVANDLEELDEPMEVDGIKAMVEGVKSRGGKDLLKYVKGLLG